MTTQKTIYLLFIALLFAPLAQYHLELFPETELNGHFEKSEVKIPELKKINLNKLRNHSFQNEIEQGWKENLGLKNWLIKSNNQINYSLLNYTDAHTVIGKKKVLYSEPYIKTYLGEDFIGDSTMNSFVEKLKFIQDTLSKRNKFFFVLLAPGKPTFIPNCIPDRYESHYGKGKTNYELFTELAQNKKINLFDASSFLTNSKFNNEFPIFPKNGIHWSGFAVAHVADSLVDYISTKSHFRLPKIELLPGEVTIRNYRFTDYDIGEALNLLFFASNEQLHYPVMKFESNRMNKPKLLGVGDSFIQSFYGFYPFLDSVFDRNNSILWYYNQQLGWPLQNLENPIKAQWMSFEVEVSLRDIFILEMTEENIKKVGYGFIDSLYNFFKGNYVVTDNNKHLFEDLRKNPELIQKAESIYKLVGYTKDQMINAMATNKIRNKWQINFNYDKQVDKVIKAIYGDKKWLESIKSKAYKQNISIPEAVRKDAIWVVNENLGIN